MSRTQTAMVLLGLRASDGTRPKIGFMQTAAMVSACLLVAAILRFLVGAPSWVCFIGLVITPVLVAFWFDRTSSTPDR